MTRPDRKRAESDWVHCVADANRQFQPTSIKERPRPWINFTLYTVLSVSTVLFVLLLAALVLEK